MKVKELIKELEKFDEEMEVQYFYEPCGGTMPITEVSIQNEDYESDEKEVIVFS
ncbi:e25 [Lactococcus phage bIL170]|uniref:E25 n=2 Tax=Skunavirus bIL170 TaxID=63118 RepID=O80135_9CAUD|nr:e25 [Lactococcus phage bIL170]AAC27213.1 e25 [Lactococcus phage bIL170]AAR26450.1 e25 protein [Lactococcus phage bIL170]